MCQGVSGYEAAPSHTRSRICSFATAQQNKGGRRGGGGGRGGRAHSRAREREFEEKMEQEKTVFGHVCVYCVKSSDPLTPLIAVCGRASCTSPAGALN
jgi:hypothetical protein